MSVRDSIDSVRGVTDGEIEMHTVSNLPEGYREIYAVDLQKDKKTAVVVNAIGAAILVVMIVGMCFFVPIRTMFDMEKGIGNYFLRFLVLIFGSIVYMFLHELVHGITMKAFGTKKVNYGFTGLYAFAGSDEYYGKKSYITIALAPVVLFAVIFGVLAALVPREWFWVVYLLQTINISGAAGDLFVTVRFARMPKDILVKDVGVGMTVYGKA